MCLKPTDENHPFLLKKDRVFICEECWSKLRLLYENDKEKNDDVRTDKQTCRNRSADA